MTRRLRTPDREIVCRCGDCGRITPEPSAGFINHVDVRDGSGRIGETTRGRFTSWS